MSVGFLFPGGKMNIQSFKELKLEILTEVSVYGKPKKYCMIQINAEDLKNPSYSK